MTLSTYLRTIARGWRGAVAILLAGMAVTVLYTKHEPKVYQATAAGFVTSGIVPATASDQLSLHDVAKERAASYVDLATSTATATAAAQIVDNGLSGEQLLGNVTASQPTDTVLIDITAKSDSPEGAKKLADAWVQALAQQVAAIEDPKKTGRSLELRPVEPAQLPTGPVSPSKSTNYTIGGVVALLAGLAYALWAGQRKRPITSADDVGGLTGATLLAVIPRGSGQVGQPAGYVAQEAYRKLRTSLGVVAGAEHGGRAYAVAGVDNIEASVNVSARLAEAMAAAGRKVVLVDANLRGGGLSDLLGVEGGAGLKEYLSSSGALPSFHELPQLPGVQFIPAGSATDAAGELITSPRMPGLLDALRSEGYDIVVAVPPVRLAADAAIVGGVTGQTILVLDSGDTAVEAAVEALQELRAAGNHVTGAVLSGSRSGGPRWAVRRMVRRKH